MLGDFNFPGVDWQGENPAGNCNAMEQMFLNSFDEIGSTQWVNEPTFPRSGNTLDLILSSEADRVGWDR